MNLCIAKNMLRGLFKTLAIILGTLSGLWIVGFLTTALCKVFPRLWIGDKPIPESIFAQGFIGAGEFVSVLFMLAIVVFIASIILEGLKVWYRTAAEECDAEEYEPFPVQVRKPPKKKKKKEKEKSQEEYDDLTWRYTNIQSRKKK